MRGEDQVDEFYILFKKIHICALEKKGRRHIQVFKQSSLNNAHLKLNVRCKSGQKPASLLDI